jgi:hypothetical protein
MHKYLEIYGSDEGSIKVCRECKNVNPAIRWTGMSDALPGACAFCGAPNQHEWTLRQLEQGQQPTETVVVAAHSVALLRPTLARLAALGDVDIELDIDAGIDTHTLVGQAARDRLASGDWAGVMAIHILAGEQRTAQETRTLGGAAALLGVPYITLAKAADDGRLSAWKDEAGNWLVNLQAIQAAADDGRLRLKEEARARLEGALL